MDYGDNISVFTGVIATQQDISCYHCHTKLWQNSGQCSCDKGFNWCDCHGGGRYIKSSLVSYSVMSGNFIGRPNRENITDICSKLPWAGTKDYKTVSTGMRSKRPPDAATCTDAMGSMNSWISDPIFTSNHQNSPAHAPNVIRTRKMHERMVLWL